MNTNKQIRNAGTLIVLAHLAVLLEHASAHAHLEIGMTPWQSAFIVIVIFAAPLLATTLLWTRVQRAGVYLLGISMLGSLVFGACYHFVVAGPDDVFETVQSYWGTIFRVTAVLLAIIEAAGSAWSIWALRWRESRQLTGESS